jgi:hypothetical protein
VNTAAGVWLYATGGGELVGSLPQGAQSLRFSPDGRVLILLEGEALSFWGVTP